MPVDVTLSQDQIAAFERDGFVTVDRITTDEGLDWFRGEYARLLEQPMARLRDDAGVVVTTETRIFEDTHPHVSDTEIVRNSRALVSQISGYPPEEMFWWGQLLHKPAGHGRDTPWHQDSANIPVEFRKNLSLSVWVPLNDVGVDGGCMQFIPGSHLLDLAPVAADSSGSSVPFVATEVDTSKAVACPLPAAGAVLFHLSTLHYAAPNTSTVGRLAISNRFFMGDGREELIKTVKGTS